MDNIEKKIRSFKESKSYIERKTESSKIIEKYPDRIPIIVEKSIKSTLKDNIDKKKYLVPKTLSFSQFIYIIRKRIKINESEALFVFVNNKIAPSNLSIETIYNKSKDEDGFLYVIYTNENTFG